MTNQFLFDYVRTQVAERGFVNFPREMMANITPEQAKSVASEFGANVLMRLPEHDVHFFDWLRVHAPDVWDDLWSDNTDTEASPMPHDQKNNDISRTHDPYFVGIALLPDLLQEDRGFPICDLVTQPNFYFSIKNFNAEESLPFVDASLGRVEAQQELSLTQILTLEIRRAPIDIWRFAYLYRISVEEAKKTAMQLVEDGLLRYAATREGMSDFLEF